jgi:shikimate kinase
VTDLRAADGSGREGSRERQNDPDGPGPRSGFPERILLVGFMAAGKSTVGRLLAERLGYPFVDLDREVERLSGRSIPEIFDRGGEEVFRALEESATAELDAVRPVVVATGGGWMDRPALRDRWPGALRVWLRVSTLAVLERVVGELERRPMLDPGAPEGSVRRLLERRVDAYARAELVVDTDERTPAEVVACILASLGSR